MGIFGLAHFMAGWGWGCCLVVCKQVVVVVRALLNLCWVVLDTRLSVLLLLNLDATNHTMPGHCGGHSQQTYPNQFLPVLLPSGKFYSQWWAWAWGEPAGGHVPAVGPQAGVVLDLRWRWHRLVIPRLTAFFVGRHAGEAGLVPRHFWCLFPNRHFVGMSKQQMKTRTNPSLDYHCYCVCFCWANKHFCAKGIGDPPPTPVFPQGPVSFTNLGMAWAPGTYPSLL